MSAQRKMGRPTESIDGDVLRPRTVRFSDLEWEWLRNAANRSGVGVSEWIRMNVLVGVRPEMLTRRKKQRPPA